jgi:hypothetical protein
VRLRKRHTYSEHGLFVCSKLRLKVDFQVWESDASGARQLASDPGIAPASLALTDTTLSEIRGGWLSLVHGEAGALLFAGRVHSGWPAAEYSGGSEAGLAAAVPDSGHAALRYPCAGVVETRRACGQPGLTVQLEAGS